MAPKTYKNLTEEELTMILDNIFANIFVTDGDANVIYVNKNSADSLKTPEEELLYKNSRDLIKEGIIDRSTTLEALERKTTSIGTFTNKAGEEVTTISTPVFDGNGEIKMVTTYSRNKTDMDMFVSELDKERKRSDKYKAAMDFFDQSNKNRNVIIYSSQIMHDLCKTAEVIAPTDSTVMIYGESGVGKEVFAHYIHNHSTRTNNIFIPVNCAAIPSELLEAEFFGYEKGAFTGASGKGKAGLFEIANHGTIFLDEIGELPLAMQSKLLRVLESGEFRRIGSEKVQITDVRIIGATNRDLLEMSNKKEFREDLYYRLNVLPLMVPALRDRKEDIGELSTYFLERTNRRYGKKVALNDSLNKTLLNYSWPGNIRELRNIIERYVITGSENVINNLYKEEKDIAAPVSKAIPAGTNNSDSVQIEVLPLKEKMRQLEEDYIESVLKMNDGNVQKAAEQLDVHRSLIYRKIKI